MICRDKESFEEKMINHFAVTLPGVTAFHALTYAEKGEGCGPQRLYSGNCGCHVVYMPYLCYNIYTFLSDIMALAEE